MNIADSIETHARSTPDAPAFLRGERRITYAEVAALVRRAAALLARQGIAASTVVGVSMNNPLLTVLGVLALARLGAIAVPLHPNNPRARRDAIAARFGFSAFLTDRRVRSAAKARTILADRSWLQPGAQPEDAPRHPGGEHPWGVTFTSGTTGVPKGVARTHAGFFRLSKLQQPIYELGPESRFLCLMDIHNTPVIKLALEVLAHGGALVFLHERFPGAALPIERHRVTHIFASPVIMQTWLKARPAGRPRFDGIRMLVVGGGKLPPAAADAIAKRITPNLYPGYGTTEANAIALADPDTRKAHPDATGRIVPWLEAEVVDENDRPLPAGESGTLRLRGEGVATGYYGMSAAEAGPRFKDGWFYPGDIGRIGKDRVLFIEGRKDDANLNVGGPKLNVAAVEAVLAEHPSVREAAVFTVDTPAGKTRIVAAMAVRGELDKAGIMRHYRNRGGPFSELISIVQVKKLPRNAMGKVLKQQLKRNLRFKPWRAA